MPPPKRPLIEARRDQMFPTLEPAEVDRLRRFGEPRSYRAGDALVKVGEVGHGLTVVLAGEVAITRRDEFGHREAIAAFADGSGPVGTYMRRPLPGRNVADSLESGADIMYREDTPVVLMTQDEGPLFRKTSGEINGAAHAASR